MKSSRSMYSSRENGTLRVPADGILGVVDDVDLFDLPFGIVGDDHLQRAQHRHHARRAAVQVLAHAVLELRDVDDVLLLRRRRCARRSRGSTPACSRGGAGR